MKKNTLIKPFALLVALFCAVNFGFGQSIFDNPITNSNPSLSNPYTSNQNVNANITVSGIGRGTGINPNTGLDRYNARDWNLVSLDSNDYFYFTITPNAGYKINFVSFVYTGTVSATGPTSFAFRSSLDGYVANIGSPSASGTTISLTGAAYQNITGSITFRFYGWGGSNTAGTFSINDFTFNGVVSAIPCPGVATTWNGAAWNNGAPTITNPAIINGNYDTLTNGSFSACSLTVSNNTILSVADNTYVEVQNDIIVDAGNSFEVQPYGAVVQIADTGTVTNNGAMSVTKKTAPMAVALEYTYWSSPVFGETIGDGLFEANANRRFRFNALNFLDATAETNNNGATVPGQDDIDDDNNDWEWVNSATVMEPGVGYASTHDPTVFIFPGQYDYTFEGRFNTGIIDVPVYRNDGSTADKNWNFIGNPYPSAISASAFFAQNLYDASTNPSGTLDGAIYYWSQNSPPLATNNGNQTYNFATSDYAVENGSGGSGGGDNITPNGFIPSGQGFFISYSEARPLSTGTVVFNNSMRTRGATDNSLFFKNTNTKSKTSAIDNKFWINLTSDNGVFNQILVAYINGATNEDDGAFYDADKNLSAGTYASLYTSIENSTKKFAIQGKAANSINEDETIQLGFKTTINVATLYTLSIAKLQGDFLTNSPIYLVDKLLNKTHDLSVCDYTFTSEVGEFNSRFEIAFTNKTLADASFTTDANSVKITSLDKNSVSFKASNNLNISQVSIFDVLGRTLYTFKGKSNEETFKLSNLNQTVFIAKITLSNGAIITKKAVLK